MDEIQVLRSTMTHSGEVLTPRVRRRARWVGFIAIVAASIVIDFLRDVATELITQGTDLNFVSTPLESVIFGGVFGIPIGIVFVVTINRGRRVAWAAAGIVWVLMAVPWFMLGELDSLPWDDLDFTISFSINRIASQLPLAIMIASDRHMRGTRGLLVGVLIGIMGVAPAVGLQIIWRLSTGTFADTMAATPNVWWLIDVASMLYFSLLYVTGWTIARGYEQWLVHRAIESGGETLPHRP